MRLLEKLTPDVSEEPHLPLVDGVRFSKSSTTRDPEARADIKVRGIFTAQRDAFLDVAVMDTGADSYEGISSGILLRRKEDQKRGKYEERVAPHGDFAPLICSIYGTLAPESAKLLTRVTRGLDKEQDKDAAMWMARAQLQTAIIKATSLCIRSRSAPKIPPVSSPSEVLLDCLVEAEDCGVRDALDLH